MAKLPAYLLLSMAHVWVMKKSASRDLEVPVT